MTSKKSLLLICVCLALAACGGVDPDSPLGKRKAIYQAMLDTKEDLGGMLRGRIPFDGTAFTSGAAKLDELRSLAGGAKLSIDVLPMCAPAAICTPGSM